MQNYLACGDTYELNALHITWLESKEPAHGRPPCGCTRAPRARFVCLPARLPQPARPWHEPRRLLTERPPPRPAAGAAARRALAPRPGPDSTTSAALMRAPSRAALARRRAARQPAARRARCPAAPLQCSLSLAAPAAGCLEVAGLHAVGHEVGLVHHGVGAQRQLQVALPVVAALGAQVPVDRLLQPVLPLRLLSPAQRRQLVAADVVAPAGGGRGSGAAGR
jgi:hypothetical protein